jgi:hypothetical protein
MTLIRESGLWLWHTSFSTSVKILKEQARAFLKLSNFLSPHHLVRSIKPQPTNFTRIVTMMEIECSNYYLY